MSEPPQDKYAGERRPIKSREHRLSQAMATRLARAGVSANAISVAGMLAGILAGLSFAATPWLPAPWIGFLLAPFFMQLRLLANMFDGMVALQTQQASPVGELYNEIPDRVSDTFTLVGAGYAVGSCCELGYIAACLAIFIAYIRAQGRVAGSPQEYCGPMAKPHRMFWLTIASLIACLISPTSPPSWSISEAVRAWGWMSSVLSLLIAGELLTVYRRLVRIAGNLRSST